MMVISFDDQELCETTPEAAEYMGWQSIHVGVVGLHSRSVDAIRDLVREIAIDTILPDLDEGLALVGFGLDARRDAILYYVAREGSH